MFFSNAIAQAGQSVVVSEKLVTKIYFPRLMIPMGAVGAGLVDFAISFVMLLIVMAWYGVAPGWPFALVPLLMLGIVITALGVGALLAALTVSYRDFRHVVPFLVQFWMFATPCIYLQHEAARGRPVDSCWLSTPPTASSPTSARRCWDCPSMGSALAVSSSVGVLLLLLGAFASDRWKARSRTSSDGLEPSLHGIRQLPSFLAANGPRVNIMPLAIKVDRLSKRYRLGAEVARRLSHPAGDHHVGRGRSVAPFLGTHHPGPTNEWLVADAEARRPVTSGRSRDVSFEIEPGEVVGIIGRNGAGKSTLLKILSRITEPTSGRAEFTGRIGSLLEVGTGFHPELTGRENIYLNGSILGMYRREIDRKFDEIVAFAEIERFLDTPVKRYSSGMYVRLAFAVAAHLQPEILLVDEVLAVGDAQFQKKCLGQMETIARGGRTVLFVSHQMSAVQRLCKQCLLLDGGRLESFGPKNDVIARYLSQSVQRKLPGEWIDLAGGRTRAARRVSWACDTAARMLAWLHHPYPDGPLEIEVAIESDGVQRVDELGRELVRSIRYKTRQRRYGLPRQADPA